MAKTRISLLSEMGDWGEFFKRRYIGKAASY